MFDIDIKTVIISAVVALVVVMLSGLVGGDQLGSGSRFPNGLSADSTAPSAGEVRGTSFQLDNGSATTSATLDKVCYTLTDSRGVAFYAYYTSGGTFATSSTNCNS